LEKYKIVLKFAKQVAPPLFRRRYLLFVRRYAKEEEKKSLKEELIRKILFINLRKLKIL
jgi:hypothetical protein